MQVDPTPRFADMLAALGAEPRLRVLRLLLAAHPTGLVVGDIQSELGIPASTLSHHLKRLEQEGLVAVQRQSAYLRYTADADGLRELLAFLMAECCTRTGAVKTEDVLACCGPETRQP